MIVLGIIDSKPSSAAILKDGQILSAIAEERLCRMKMASGMPRQAIRQVLLDAGLTAKDIDLVAVAQRVSVFEPEPIPWNGWFDKNHAGKPRPFEKISGALAPMAGYIPFAQKAKLLDILKENYKKYISDPYFIEKKFYRPAFMKGYQKRTPAASTFEEY